MAPRSLVASNPLHSAIDRSRHRLALVQRALHRENVPLLAFLTLLVGALGVAGVLAAEAGRDDGITNLGDAVWWVVVTMSTTGYGDLVPKTPTGRIVATGIILAGMGLLSIFTASIASSLTARRIQEEKGLQRVKTARHIVICGWNGHGQRLIEGLVRDGGEEVPEVVLVNQLPEDAVADLVDRYHHWKVRYVRGDFCHEAALRRANIEGARAVIVLADASAGLSSKVDERTVLAVLAIRSLNPGVKVCAEIVEAENEVHLRRAGVDEVVVAGEHNGFLLASAAIAPGVPELVRQILSFESPLRLRRQPIDQDFVGGSFGALASHLRQTEGSILIGIISDRSGVTLNDLLAGDYSAVDSFIKAQFAEAGMEYLTLTRERAQARLNPPDDYVIARDDCAIVLGGGPS